MKNFNDVGAFRSVLQDVYEKSPSEPEQRLAGFAGVLEQQLAFTKDDAAIYASIVLTRNARSSSEWAGWNAIKVFGTWMRMSAALLKSETETWKFSDDLTCEHKLETYEGVRVTVWIELLGAVFKPPILHLGGVRFARPKPEGRHRFAKWRVARIELRVDGSRDFPLQMFHRWRDLLEGMSGQPEISNACLANEKENA